MVGVSLRQNPVAATHRNAAVLTAQPVSGTPLWARSTDPGQPRPASPWDEWTIPPKPRGLDNARKPSPHPTETFRPWRIDFTEPDRVHYPVEQPAEDLPEVRTESATVARRLMLLLGLAYLLLAALASGLAYTGYFTETDEPEPQDEPDGTLPPVRPPSRDPNAPGLHTRPDGSRYLVMPLPKEVADRLRGRAPAIEGGAA